LKYSRSHLPDFIIIGAAKSGTSSLFHYFENHDHIFIPGIKEIEFFCKDENYSKGIEWYKKHFNPAGNNQVCGDASTTYSRWPHTADVPKRIFELIPKVKLIYILRHPVERTYSHYLHHMRQGITMSFEQALSKDDIYVDCSRYMMQIEHYLRFIPKDNLLLVFLNDLQNNPADTLFLIQDFIGVPQINLVEDGEIVANKSSADFYIRAKTTKRLLNLPGGMLLKNMLPSVLKDKAFRLIKRSRVGESLKDSYKPQNMLPETRVALLKQFREDTEKLEKFLDIDLKEWYS